LYCAMNFVVSVAPIHAKAGIEPACPSIESNTYRRNRCLKGASRTFASGEKIGPKALLSDSYRFL
jgi:hypothetical protein